MMKLFFMQESGFPEIIEVHGETFLFKNLILNCDKARYEFAVCATGLFDVITDFREFSRAEIVAGKLFV